MPVLDNVLEVASDVWRPNPERITIEPDRITVRVGNLEMRTTETAHDSRIVPSGHSIEVFIDGVRVMTRSLTIRMHVDEIVRCELEFLPELPDELRVPGVRSR